MSDESDIFTFAAVMVLVIVAMLIGGCAGRDDLRKEAVKAGVAEWRATPEGDVTFHWKEPKK